MEELLRLKFEQIKAELESLFSSDNITLLHGRGDFYRGYAFNICDQKNQRLGYLKVRFYGVDEILDLQLLKDNSYQLNKGIFGCSWFISDNYKKPENYQEIERFLAGIWSIFD
jgi:hypothetical protein